MKFQQPPCCQTVGELVTKVGIPSIWHHKAVQVNDTHCQINMFLMRLPSVWLPSLLSKSVRLPSFCVLGYRVTRAVLVCGVPQSPKGPQLRVMVSISLAPDWKKVCVCVRSEVCFALFIARRRPSSCRLGAAVTSLPQRTSCFTVTVRWKMCLTNAASLI